MNKSNESEIWELFPKGGYIGSCSKIAQFDFFRSPFSVLRFISVQVVPVLCVEVLPLSNSASSKISSLFSYRKAVILDFTVCQISSVHFGFFGFGLTS